MDFLRQLSSWQLQIQHIPGKALQNLTEILTLSSREALDRSLEDLEKNKKYQSWYNHQEQKCATTKPRTTITRWCALNWRPERGERSWGKPQSLHDQKSCKFSGTVELNGIKLQNWQKRKNGLIPCSQAGETKQQGKVHHLFVYH